MITVEFAECYPKVPLATVDDGPENSRLATTAVGPDGDMEMQIEADKHEKNNNNTNSGAESEDDEDLRAPKSVQVSRGKI